MINRKIIAKVEPTPDELASEFCEMDSEAQVVFFNALAEQVAKWDKPFCFQLAYVSSNDHLTDEARYVMQQIGEYGPKTNQEDE